jgi:hypothetical protein
MDSFEELVARLQSQANDDEHLQMINTTISIGLQTMMQLYRQNPNISKDELKEKTLRKTIDILGINIHDLMRLMTLINFNKDVALMVLDSPEFQQVKQQYFKCSYFNEQKCIICTLYKNGNEDILQRFEDFVDFNMIDHYIGLYDNYVKTGEEEDMDKLYNKFKDYHSFHHYNMVAKKNALDWLIPINGDDDDEMVGWINRH